MHKISYWLHKRCLDLKNNFTSLNLSLTLKVIRQLAFLPTIQYSKNGNCNSNLKISVTWKFRMLSMKWDAFDGIRKKIRHASIQ